MKVTIIIPVLNEKNTVLKLIEEVARVKLQNDITKEIIIIDDGSRDGTTTLLKSLPQDPLRKIIFKSQNQGKTSAVKAGVEHSTGDYILIQDADLEYSPLHYPSLLAPAIHNKAPVVYGSRFKGTIKNMTPINLLSNKISNATMNLLFNAKLTDFHTCLKLIRKDLLKDINITSHNFSFDTEITAKLLKKNIPILEIPINYTARTRKQGKKITWGKALETYFVIFQCRCSDNN